MITPIPTPTFQTKRLAVFRQDVVISEILCAERAIFTAFLKDEDTPRIVATMLVSLDMMYLDWISTDEDFRRKGYAEELWRGVEQHFNTPLVADGATNAGIALCAKMEEIDFGNAGGGK